MFAKELHKIWTEINSLHNRFAQIDQPNAGDVNNIQLNTFHQENKDLSQEISILKVRLQEDNNTLKKITEERDSYRKALQNYDQGAKYSEHLPRRTVVTTINSLPE